MDEKVFREQLFNLDELINTKNLKNACLNNNLLTYWETCLRQDYIKHQYLPIGPIVSNIFADLLNNTLKSLGLPTKTTLIINNSLNQFDEILVKDLYMEDGIALNVAETIDHSPPLDRDSTQLKIKEGLIHYLSSFDTKRDVKYIWADGLLRYMSNNPTAFLTDGMNIASIFLALLKQQESQNYMETLKDNKKLNTYIEIYEPYAEKILNAIGMNSIDPFSIWEEQAYKEHINQDLINPNNQTRQ